METITLTIPESLRISDEQLFEFCSANDWFKIERNAHGQLTIMSPSGGTSGIAHLKIYRAFADWCDRHPALGIGVDASVGFRLPDGSVLAPDAAFVSLPRWNALTTKEQEKFPPLCPDFVIEVRSPSDSLAQLKEKMIGWIRNGCKLAWLIDPVAKKALVYGTNGLESELDTLTGILTGGSILPGFELDLSRLA